MSIVAPTPTACWSVGHGGRVVYLCPWHGASGGIQVLYEHVRLLRRAGVQAMLGAPGAFRRCSWFANDPVETPAIANCLAGLTDADILVVPEIAVGAAELDGLPGRRLAFVQNPGLLRGSLRGYAGVVVPTPVLVPWLQRRAGQAPPVAVVPGFLHEELLRPFRRFTRQRPRVLIVDRPDKHRGEPAEARAQLVRRGMAVTCVDRPLSRREFTALFASHDVYLHLSYPEGFPISILEAFGAGCLVIGFAGCGGLEFMHNAVNCCVVPDGCVAEVVERLELVLRAPRTGLDAMLASAWATAHRYGESSAAAALARILPNEGGPVVP